MDKMQFKIAQGGVHTLYAVQSPPLIVEIHVKRTTIFDHEVRLMKSPWLELGNLRPPDSRSQYPAQWLFLLMSLLQANTVELANIRCYKSGYPYLHVTNRPKW